MERSKNLYSDSNRCSEINRPVLLMDDYCREDQTMAWFWNDSSWIEVSNWVPCGIALLVWSRGPGFESWLHKNTSAKAGLQRQNADLEITGSNPAGWLAFSYSSPILTTLSLSFSIYLADPLQRSNTTVFLFKWLLSFAAWEKASLICKKNNKRCINMIIQSCSCCIAKIDWLLWRSWIRIPLRNGLFSFLYLYFSLSCASFNRS